MKKFNYKRVKVGQTICTRDGKSAEVVHIRPGQRPEVVAIIEKDGYLQSQDYQLDGRVWKDTDSHFDLMIPTREKSGWVNLYRDAEGDVYPSMVYESEMVAKGCTDNAGWEYVTTVEIKWEE